MKNLSSEHFDLRFDSSNLLLRVFGGCIQISPDGSGPAGIVWMTADDVQMHLGHEVSYGGEIDFRRAEFRADEIRDLGAFIINGMSNFRWEA